MQRLANSQTTTRRTRSSLRAGVSLQLKRKVPTWRHQTSGLSLSLVTLSFLHSTYLSSPFIFWRGHCQTTHDMAPRERLPQMLIIVAQYLQKVFEFLSHWVFDVATRVLNFNAEFLYDLVRYFASVSVFCLRFPYCRQDVSISYLRHTRHQCHIDIHYMCLTLSKR